MTNKEGYLLAISTLRNILRALTLICPLEHRARAEGYDTPINEYLPIKDWGKPGNIHNLKLKWHFPSENEIALAQKLFNKFLGEELNALDKFVDGQLTLNKDELLNRLTVINSIMYGAGGALPFWRGETPVKLLDTVLVTEPFSLYTSSDGVQLNFDGKNARRVVTDAMVKIQKYLLQQNEDDTKSLMSVVQIYQTCLLFGGLTKEDYDARMKNFHVIKKALDIRLVGSKKQLRPLIVDRVFLQHESRMLERCHVPLTQAHVQV